MIYVLNFSHYLSSGFPVVSFLHSSRFDLSLFLSPHLSLAFTSLEKNAPPVVPYKPIFSPPQLLLLFKAAWDLPLAPLYVYAFSIAFLATLHISNLAPSSYFDPLRHLWWGMFIFALATW
jgi:hypothetical protein